MAAIAAPTAGATAAEVAANSVPQSTLQRVDRVPVADGFLPHGRLSQNDETHVVLSGAQKDIALLEKAYRMTLDHLKVGHDRKVQFPTARNVSEYDAIRAKASRIHHLLKAKLEQSTLIGRDAIPAVEEFESGRLGWTSWQPEDLTGRPSFQPNRSSFNARAREMSDDEELDKLGKPSAAPTAAAAAAVSTASAVVASTTTPVKAPGGGLARKWQQSTGPAATAVPASAASAIGPAAVHHTSTFAPITHAGALPPPTPPTLTANANTSGIPLLSSQLYRPDGNGPAPAAVSQHFSVKTQDAVTRENYDTSQDTVAKPGVQMQQSRMRIIFTTLFHRLFATNAAGASANRLGDESGGSWMTRHCGRI